MDPLALILLATVALAVPIVAFFGGRMPNLLGRRLRCDLWKALREKESFWQVCLERRLSNMQASAECPSNSTKLYQVDPIALLMLGSILVIAPIIGFFLVIGLAAFVYVWTHSYPWLKMVGKFGAKPLNLFSLLILYVLVVIALVFIFVMFTGSTGSTSLLLGFLMLLVLVPLFIVGFLLMLAIIVWIARLIKWLFAHWRGWLEGVYFSVRLGLIRLKIKADTLQETGFRGKPGSSVRAKSATGFKMRRKEMSFKEKLEALRSEISGDVQRARSKLSRRK